MPQTFIWTLRFLGLCCLFIFLLAGDRYMAMKLSLPELNGAHTVKGLTASVSIIRDKNGIPHITGETQADALFGLGYAHAQDRLWQMETTRLIANGRLSEVLGSTSIPIDIYFRTLNFAGHVAASYPKLSSKTKGLLEAYTNGINAFLDSDDLKLPPEFLLLFHRPEAWQPADSLLVIKMMSVGLSTNMGAEISRALLSQQLTTAQLTDFYPPYPGDTPIILPQIIGDLYGTEPVHHLASSLPKMPITGASNNWVIDGRHTASGKPLLANDPHLELTAPSIWYLAHLQWPGGNVIGSTIAGLPLIVLGRNERIAWGFTNTGADVQDLYVEKVNPSDENEYLTPDGYVPFEIRDESIKVRFGRDLQLKLRRTRHGPVLSDHSSRVGNVTAEGHVIALEWTALTDDDRTIEAGLHIMEAANFSDFESALSSYSVPMQNIVYADIDGNIGFIAPAFLPIRSAENDLYGLIPAPGWLAKYDWQGVVPFEQLPRQYNPASGRIVTANQKIVPDDYPHFITSHWQPPLRAKRISQLLEKTARHDTRSFESIQADEVSDLARTLLPQLLHAAPISSDGQWALALLRHWDGDMNQSLSEPLLFTAWYRALTRLIYADELGTFFPSYWGFRPIFMKSVLDPNTTQSVWCDNIETASQENCSSIIANALDEAMADLRARYGDDRSNWIWGNAHKALHRHQILGQIPFLKNLFNIAVETGGGFYTINRGGHWFNSADPFTNIHGSGYRAIYDLSDLDQSVFIQTTGQSGNAFSPFYKSYVEDWARVAYVSMTTNSAAYSKDAVGHLTLEPLSID